MAEAELASLFVPQVVVTDIILPAQTASGKPVTWVSDNPELLTAQGIVTFPDVATDVRLTATVSGKTRDLVVCVRPRDIMQTGYCLIRLNLKTSMSPTARFMSGTRAVVVMI